MKNVPASIPSFINISFPFHLLMFPFIKASHATKKVKGEDTSIYPGQILSWSLPNISEIENNQNQKSSSANQDNSIQFTIYAVFDGHGGAESSIFCKDSFVNFFVSVVDKLSIDKMKEQLNQSTMMMTAWEMWTSVLDKAIIQTFIDLDNACKSQFAESGTTASVLIVTMENELPHPTKSRRVMITTSNVGDSYICYDSGHGAMIRISDNHRVSGNKSEQERVKNEGGYVGPFPPEEPTEEEVEASNDANNKKGKNGSKKDKKGKKSNDQQKKQQEEKEKDAQNNASMSSANSSKKVDDGSYPLRIWPGGLMMSRTIGDLEALQATPIPFVSSYFLKVFTSNDKAVGCGGGRIIIASDGLWDEVTFKDASKFTNKKNAEHAAASLCNMASRSAGIYKDDITVIVVDFLGSSSSTTPYVPHAESSSDIEISPILLKIRMHEDKKTTTKAILLDCITRRKALGPCIRQNRAVLGSTVERIGENGNLYKVIDIEDDGILFIESDPPTWVLEEDCNLIIPQEEVEINEAEEGTKNVTINDDDLEQLALYLAATDIESKNEWKDDNEGFQQISYKKQNPKKVKGNDAAKKSNNNSNENQKKQPNKPPKQKQRNNKLNKASSDTNQDQSNEMKAATSEENGNSANSIESTGTSSEEKSESTPNNAGEANIKDKNQPKSRRYGDRYNRNGKERGNASAQSQTTESTNDAGNGNQDQSGEQKKRFTNNYNRRNNQGNDDKRTTSDQNGNQRNNTNQNASQDNQRFRHQQQRASNASNSNNQGQTSAAKENGNINASASPSSLTDVNNEQKERQPNQPRQQYQRRYPRKSTNQSDNTANDQGNPKQEDASNKSEGKKPNDNRPRNRYPRKTNQSNTASSTPVGQTSA